MKVSPVISPGKVLVVDDESANVELLKRLLTSEGYNVVTASDGQQALDMVQHEHPDLVLMDVLMPKLSGFEVCERIKQNKATRLTPVVLVTALLEREDKIQGINAGADDFLTKPVNVHELRARVRSLVRLKRYTDDLDSAESVILSLALVIEARDAYTTAIASVSPGMPRLWEPRWGCRKTSSRRSTAEGTFTTWGRSAFRMPCC